MIIIFVLNVNFKKLITMKNKLILTLLLSFFTGLIYAQDMETDTKVGDEFYIAEVDNNNYEHIEFPRSNFIIKKGGIPNYDSVKGENVEITSIKEKKNGNIIATIKLTSNKKAFFNSHKHVKVDIENAIKNKELVKI